MDCHHLNVLVLEPRGQGRGEVCERSFAVARSAHWEGRGAGQGRVHNRNVFFPLCATLSSLGGGRGKWVKGVEVSWLVCRGRGRSAGLCV